MLKKITMFFFISFSLWGLNGCGTESTENSNGNNNNLVTLFLVDENGNSYGRIPYICDSMTEKEYTLSNGEFTFLPPDDCEFDFFGLEGTSEDDTLFDDIVRIVDSNDNGKNNIDYDCNSFGVGATYTDGRFHYDIDDACVFYL
jgi:hypothetical protein